MSERHWTEDLKPGDMVAIKGYDYGQRDGIPAKVSRLTATQVIVELPKGHESRFRKNDGGMVGGGSSWFQLWLVEMTPELEHRFALRSVRQKVWEVLKRSTKDTYSLEVWRELLAILERKE